MTDYQHLIHGGKVKRDWKAEYTQLAKDYKELEDTLQEAENAVKEMNKAVAAAKRIRYWSNVFTLNEYKTRIIIRLITSLTSVPAAYAAVECFRIYMQNQ